MRRQPGERVWVRLGDSDDYADYDSPSDAAGPLASHIEVTGGKVPRVSRHGRYGVEADPFLGPYDYISLFWGDGDAQPTRSLTNADLREFRAGLRDALYDPTRVKPERRSKSRTARSREHTTRTAGGLR